MIKRGIFLAVLFTTISCFSQNQGWMAYPVDSDSVQISDTVQIVKAQLDYSQPEGKVTVHRDDRIVKIESFIRAGEETLEGVLIDGYRVLIYFDQDKTNSEQQKAHFMNLYDEHLTYIDYLAPNYRVRVGNFRTKLEAEKLKQDVLGIFPTAIVVSDKIQLPNLPVDLDEQ